MATRADLYALLAAAQLRQAAAQRQPARPRLLGPPVQAGPVAPQAGFTSPRQLPNQIQWGGQSFANPAALVAWMNARGAGTSVGRFLANHPGVAAQYGQRQALAQPAPPSLLSRLTVARSAVRRPRPDPYTRSAYPSY